MFKIHKEVVQWGGQELTFETGKMARQADGAVLVTLGDTAVLATVVGEKTANAERDFFPLTVHYQEKKYAAGRIPGGFFKREGRPSEFEVLTSRLIDRPIRPLFPKTFKNEVQVICTVLSHDEDHDPSIVSMIAASAALSISGIPFLGPIGAARVGRIDGKLLLNPTPADMDDSDLDVVVAGTAEGILMVESEARELPEATMLEAVLFGHESYQPVIDGINKLKQRVGKTTWDVPPLPAAYLDAEAEVKARAENGLREAYAIREKTARRERIDIVKGDILEKFADREDVSPQTISSILHHLEQEIVRKDLLKTGTRIDGRDTKTVRPIMCETGMLPRAHGCALFTRGETQALVVATLGTPEDEQIMENLGGEYKEPFMLHYNFPPFSVGETGRMGSPGRREIGHGKLAWRAIAPMLPERDAFPYTLRIVSEILESNGSSSMATVCGSSLALMDAGVPLKDHVAGIAMGLVKEGDDYAVLTDILGDEDHLGDMDFKVAGTRDGVTALQMDIKITSINAEIMKTALEQARHGRLHIIGEMEKAMTGARDSVSEHAPQIVTMQIPVDKIRDVIGTGGKVIREICETTDTKISIEDDGKVTISGVGQDKIDAARTRIEDITAEAEIGGIYKGKVTKITDFGAFVNFLGTFGLIHVSEIAKERVEKVSDHLNVGDEVQFKVVGADDRGKLRLSMKALLADAEA